MRMRLASFSKVRMIGVMIAALVALSACSGIETIPDDTSAFEATRYSRYAWRSEPLSSASYSKDRLYAADAAVRESFDQRMKELGYELVAKDQAQFLVEYLAAAGINDGRLSSTVSNVRAYPSTTINRQADGATVDNAYALGGVKETGNVLIVFADAENANLLWQVSISTVVQDTNRVDSDAVGRAIRQGLSTLPESPY